MNLEPNATGAARPAASSAPPPPGAANPPPRPGPGSSRLRILLAILAIVSACAWYFGRPAPEAPVPAQLSQLEPQLRAYVLEKVQWARQAPRRADRQADLAMVYAANGLWVEAWRGFSNVVVLNPREPLGHMYLAVAAQELGALEVARGQFGQLTTQFPSFPQGFYRLGEASLRAGADKEALQAFQRLTELAPTEWRGYFGVGQCRLRLGAVTGAVQALERAVQLAPHEKLAHFQLGQAYQRAGRQDDAARELRLGANADHYPMPDAWSASAYEHMKKLSDQIELALGYLQADQAGRAVNLLERALVYHPNELSLLNHLANAYLQVGQPKPARALLDRALGLNERFVPAHLTYSAACLALNLTNEALAHASRAIELGSNNVQPRLGRANVLLALARDREALADVEAALQLEPQSAQLHWEAGEILLRNLEQPEAALAHYQRATELNPALLPAWVRLTEQHLRRGNLAAARKTLETLRKLAPQEPAVKVLTEGLQRRENPPSSP